MNVLADLELTFGGDNFLDPAGQRSGLIMLGSLLLSFLLIRTSTRLMRSPKVPWWPGSIKTGGVHVHHLVPGIVLMLLCGFLLALEPASPWVELVAAGFGVGAGLTLDEYALWLHLDDVYWAEEGRQSVDAVVIAATVGGLLLLGFVPFSTDSGIVTIVASTLAAFAIAVVNALKGKYVFAVVSMLIPVVGARHRPAPRQARVGLGPQALRAGQPQARAGGEALRAPHRPLPALSDSVAGAPTDA